MYKDVFCNSNNINQETEFYKSKVFVIKAKLILIQLYHDIPKMWVAIPQRQIKN
jgi:hypothetical protein